MRRRRGGLGAPGIGIVIAGALTVLGAGDGAASGYVRQTASHGTPLAWRAGCIYVTPDAAGAQDLSPDATLGEITQSTHNWTDNTGCSYMAFHMDAPISGKHGQLDGTNLVIWLGDRWGRQQNGTFMPYSPQAPALTTIFFVDDDQTRSDPGKILDADTELNEVNFHFAIVTDPLAQNTVMDVQNTLTHEFGHMLGLDHTCYAGESPNHPLDNTGQPTPLCAQASLPAAITDATMYNFADLGEIKKRSPEADDIQGICEIYPIAAGPKACIRVQPDPDPSANCSCAVGGRAGGGTSIALLGLFTGLACIRSRRRSGCGAGACGRPRACGGA